MKLKEIAIVVAVVALGGCMASMGVKNFKFDKSTNLQNGIFEVTVNWLATGGNYTNYYADVKVKNISDKEAIFDSGDLELINEESGVSFYSVSKDKSAMSVPIDMADVIMTSSLKPGRMIAGKIMFPTAVNKAKSKKLRLIYGSSEIPLQ